MCINALTPLNFFLFSWFLESKICLDRSSVWFAHKWEWKGEKIQLWSSSLPFWNFLSTHQYQYWNEASAIQLFIMNQDARFSFINESNSAQFSSISYAKNELVSFFSLFILNWVSIQFLILPWNEIDSTDCKFFVFAWTNFSSLEIHLNDGLLQIQFRSVFSLLWSKLINHSLSPTHSTFILMI